MQLFTFGHPCEHQLRRVCIGGTSCPLNGYPDHWCCSFVKGRINFKRDKPCEGARCRWGFAHPPASSFDSVTQVLQEGRACAAKMEEGYGSGSLHGGPYVITSTHAADVAHCALNFLRIPPARVAPRVGGLLAFAAIKAGDAKVFTQLLKTVKKPVDDYVIGAFDYIHAQRSAKPSKTEAGVIEDLRHDILTIMGSALSHGGELIHRPEQLPLQTHYLAALKTATRNKKKYADALENASGMFPEAAEAPAPVLPETWRKASGVAEAATTPESKPIVPSAKAPATPSAPANDPKRKTTPLQAPSTPQQQPIGARVADPKAKQLTPKTSAAIAPPTKTEAPKAPSSADAKQPRKTLSPTSAAPQPAAAVPRPEPPVSLFAACQALNTELPSGQDDGTRPVFGMFDAPPAPARLVLGGLFSLDMGRARGVPNSASTSGDNTPKAAPLGPAMQDEHAFAAWGKRASDMAACESNAERRAELQAAAAALAAADVILETMS